MTAQDPRGPSEPHRRRPEEDEPFSALGDEPRERTYHVIDRFDGALGLLFLRLAVAAVVGVRGLQKIQHRDETEQMLRAVRLPAPDLLGMLFGPVQLAMAVALVLGLAVRVVGAGIAASAITALVLVNWSAGAVIFTEGVPGFNGDLQLLLAGVGLALLGVGGGAVGLDRSVRHRGTSID